MQTKTRQIIALVVGTLVIVIPAKLVWGIVSDREPLAVGDVLLHQCDVDLATGDAALAIYYTGPTYVFAGQDEVIAVGVEFRDQEGLVLGSSHVRATDAPTWTWTTTPVPVGPNTTEVSCELRGLPEWQTKD